LRQLDPAAYERAAEELAAPVAAFGGTEVWSRFFKNRFVPQEQKRLLLREAGTALDLHPLTVNLLHLLLDKGRIELLGTVATCFRELVDQELSRATAEVHSAVPLSEGQSKRLCRALSKETGRTVRLAVTVDPTLLGGLVARVGDTVYDGSLRRQLAKARATLSRE
jgi:F-type H+-transporting ATPase subunit delta